MFKLWYYVQNGGDGSASTFFFTNKTEAIEAEKAQSEGWAESSVESVDLCIKDGKIVMSHLEWNGEKHINVFKTLSE